MTLTGPSNRADLDANLCYIFYKISTAVKVPKYQLHDRDSQP